MKKKTIAMLLAAVMSVSAVLTGCGQSSGGAGASGETAEQNAPAAQGDSNDTVLDIGERTKITALLK